MVNRRELTIRARIDESTLEAFIAERWLVPAAGAGPEAFSEADVARAHLIRELRADCGVNDEGVGVILHLIDQLHDLRRTLKDVLLRESRAAGDRDPPPC